MHKHILFILDYYLPHKGWSETVFEAIISRLLAKGYTVSVLTSHFDSEVPAQESKENFHIYRVGKNRISFMFWALIKGKKILKKNKDISLIHTSTYGGAIPASLLGKMFHKRVILTVHEIFWRLRTRYKWRATGRFYRFFERLIFWMPYNVYHCVSAYTMNSVRLVYGIPDKKITMIHNGVDTNFRNPEEVSQFDINTLKNKYGRSNRFVITYYGHAGKSKWLDYLVRALPELVPVDSKLVFVFNLIDSKRTEAIKEQIRKYHLGSSVQIFDGFEKDELRTLIASSDMIVAPSLSEGFGSVHTESVAMGKPLITTYVASLPEVVRGNVKFIAPASKREIIQAILERDTRIQNPEYIIPTKEFSRNDTVRELIKIYR
ncbi:MAG: glycosyl transferase group 1 [uncultured bacterium (gcode 4)]|uniref:Glycosyl transferase group 1 n=1 Tax=uncultured bacterium (gcode 4) TaxID=1234023 RepID=K1X4R9_9BACT|nr:MAG: glycosyl transferase group 1 [uncultured bacterium (gcode 4)]